MYLPVISLNRSQDMRLGNGTPEALIPNSQDPQLFHAYHVNLADGNSRRDLQRHSAIGGVEAVGALSTKWTDLFAASGGTVSNGTGASVNVSAFTLQSRLFTDQTGLSVAAITNLATPASAAGDLFYLVAANPDGTVVATAGGASNGAPTYEVDSVSLTGASAGTFTLSFTYNGYYYTTAPIAYNATAAAVASALNAATSPTGPALPASVFTGTGGAIGSAAVTITASGALEGPITNQSINYTAATGATAGTFTQTTAGVGAIRPAISGNQLPLAYVFITQAATAPTAIENIVLTS